MLSQNPILTRESFWRNYTDFIGLEFMGYSYVIRNFETSMENIRSYLLNAGPFDGGTFSYGFTNVRIEVTKHYYDECLKDGIMYAIEFRGDYHTFVGKEMRISRNVLILRLPRMIGSYAYQGYIHSGNPENLEIRDGFFILVGGKGTSKTYVLNKWEMLHKGRPITSERDDLVVCEITSNNPIKYDTGKVRIFFNGFLKIDIGRKMFYMDTKAYDVNFIAFHIFWALVSQLSIFLEDSEILEKFKIWIKDRDIELVDVSIIEVYKFMMDKFNNEFKNDKKYFFQSLHPADIADKFINQIDFLGTKSVTRVYINSCVSGDFNLDVGNIDSEIYDLPIKFGLERISKTSKSKIRKTEERKVLDVGEAIIEKLKRYNQILSNTFFPHIVNGDKRKEMREKFILSSEMVYRVAMKILDDRDDMGNKFFDTPGSIIENTTIKAIINSKFKVSSGIIYEHVQNLIYSNFRTGSWSATKDVNVKTRDGASEIIYPENFKDGYNFGKCCVSRSKNGPMVNAGRGTHRSQIGYKCKSHTPEGKQVGLLTFDCLHVKISSDQNAYESPSARKSDIGFPLTPTYLYLIDWMNMNPLNPKAKKAMVMYNDRFIEFISENDMKGLVDFMRDLRRKGLIDYETGISIHEYKDIKKVEIRISGGRPLMPLFTVKDDKIEAEDYVRKNYDKPNLEDLVEKGYVEWIDPREIQNFDGKILENPAKILKGDYVYCVMDPSFYLSYALAVGSRFTGNTASQRWVYMSQLLAGMSNHFKPRKGVEVKSDISFKEETEDPIIENVITRAWKLSGRNVLAASMVMLDNTEDAVICSEEYMNSMNIINFDHIDVNIPIQNEVNFEGKMIKFTDLAMKYRLEKNGIVGIGEILTKGKPIYIRVDDRGVATIAKYDKHIDSIVHQIIFVGKEGIENIYKIEIKISLPMMPGDKTSTLHGQKGVAADKIKTEDMFYDPLSGESMQVIVNPLGLIGRLTPGQMKEGIIARAFPSGRTHKVLDLVKFVEDTIIEDFYIPCVMLDPYYKERTKKETDLLEKYGMKKTKIAIDWKDIKIYKFSFIETQKLLVDYVLYTELNEKIKRFFIRRNIGERLPHSLIKREFMPESLIRLRISAFEDSTQIENEALERLKEMGYPEGKTYLINPMTGKRLDTPIFVGVLYQITLKQRAALKFRIADKAPINPYTGEFSKGGKKGGGFKVGKMEWSEFAVIGIGHIIKEKIEVDKIKSYVTVCKRCENFSYINFKEKRCGCGGKELEERLLPPYTIRYSILSFGAGIGLAFMRSQTNTF